MRVSLTLKEFEGLFINNQNCIVIPEWDGGPCTFNMTDQGECYIRRWEECEPCTDMMSLGELYNYVNGNFKIHIQDYKDLF